MPPGTRGGIFTEKITDAERVLAVILGLRKVCGWDVIAEPLPGKPPHHRQRHGMGEPLAGRRRMHDHPIHGAVSHSHRAAQHDRKTRRQPGHTGIATLILTASGGGSLTRG